MKIGANNTSCHHKAVRGSETNCGVINIGHTVY